MPEQAIRGRNSRETTAGASKREASAASGVFSPLLRGPLGCGPQRRTQWGGACVSTLPLWFRANSLLWPLLASPGGAA